MISKSRLEELIEQEKQVWKINKDTYEEAYQVPAGLFGIEFSSQVDETTPFNELFETKEEAEWYREFGCIERTERLEFPTWEEFETTDISVKFYNKSISYSMYVFVKNKNTNNCRIIICAYNGEQDWWVFEKPLTKENYTIACRKAKELFLGQSNDN